MISTDNREHTLMECYQAIAGVIGEKRRALHLKGSGRNKRSQEDQRLREYWFSVLQQCERDYAAILNDKPGTG